MAEGKKFTQYEMEAIKNKLDLFDYLKSFINIDLSAISDKEMDDVVLNYEVKVLLEHAGVSTFNLSDVSNIYKKIISKSGYIGLRKHFSILQYSLIEKFEEVRGKLENDELIAFNGTTRVILNHSTNRYETRYLPLNFDKDKDIDITTDCEILDSLFFEIVSYLLLERPKGRLKICNKCDSLFFQVTDREKIFCSTKCARASAQAEYIKKQRKKGK